MRSLFKTSLPALLLLTAVSAPAQAQVLTVEVEGSLELSAPQPNLVAPPRVEPRPEPYPSPRASGAVVVVRPLEDEPIRPSRVRVIEPPRPAPPQPQSWRAMPVPPSAPAPEQPASGADSDDRFGGTSGMGLAVEYIDLSPFALTLEEPEIEGATGLQLPAGHPALTQVQPSAMIMAGMRVGWFRGPELRLYGGGASLDTDRLDRLGPYDAEITGIGLLRVELAMGIQPDTGDVRPYLLGTASVGFAWVDIVLSQPSNGRLGTETPMIVMGSLGAEAGIEFDAGGILFGLGVRASFVETLTVGGVVSMRFGG